MAKSRVTHDSPAVGGIRSAFTRQLLGESRTACPDYSIGIQFLGGVSYPVQGIYRRTAIV